MLLGPVESFFGVEVGVVQGVVIVADVRSRESSSHELSIGAIVDWRIFAHSIIGNIYHRD
jgi:hypothetical protein